MNKKQSKRRRDIKSKLMAAICMLLVSSIMMVSTTYAWFTLSTAPEVTGINTAVGANGNLEMALQPLDGDSSKITSTTADSMVVKSAYEANTTWGNLVDLAPEKTPNVYGLNDITLYPAELNTVAGAEEGKLRIAVAPLSTPRYGYDGRVTKLVQETYTATKVGDAGFSGRGDYGVRAIGLATGASAREVAFNIALAAASSATSQAQIKANASLSENGVALTDIAMTHGLPQGDTESYDEADKAAVAAMLSGIDASLDQIEIALLQYILAESVGHAQDTTYETLVTNFAEVTLTNYTEKGYTAPGALATYITKLQEMQGKVQTAQTALGKMSGGTYTWDQISGALTPLVNMKSDNMTINNYTIDDAMANKNDILQAVVDGGGLTLKLGSGSGLYADIADFCGDYSAFFKAPVSYNGLSLNVSTTVLAHNDNPPPFLKAAANESDYVSEGTAAVAVMNEFYGYIVDLAFRTNAAGSHLKLQAEGVDRIYNGNDLNEDTMGHGATMSFKSDSVNFPADSVENLMKAIRIVFFDTNDMDIITYGKLDAVNKSNEADGTITMPIVLTDKDGNAKMDGEDYDYRIMALDQNAIHELSVMVYLDGNSVTNADVAYDAESGKSMTGKMNLQFSSTATLVPMEYSDLKNGSDSGDDSETPDTTTPLTTGVTVTDAAGVISNGGAALVGNQILVKLNGWTEGMTSTVTVKIGDNPEQTGLTPVVKDGVYGVTVTAPEGFVANTTTVAVTIVSATP